MSSLMHHLSDLALMSSVTITEEELFRAETSGMNWKFPQNFSILSCDWLEQYTQSKYCAIFQQLFPQILCVPVCSEYQLPLKVENLYNT